MTPSVLQAATKTDSRSKALPAVVARGREIGLRIHNTLTLGSSLGQKRKGKVSVIRSVAIEPAIAAWREIEVKVECVVRIAARAEDRLERTTSG